MRHLHGSGTGDVGGIGGRINYAPRVTSQSIKHQGAEFVAAMSEAGRYCLLYTLITSVWARMCPSIAWRTCFLPKEQILPGK
jgi:hypothetical protein